MKKYITCQDCKCDFYSDKAYLKHPCCKKDGF